MIKPIARGVMILMSLAAVGCSSSQTFDVTVTNRLPDPITVWMTKEVPDKDNPEQGWVPPELLAVGTIETEKLGGVAIQPGETGHTVLKGHIVPDNVAILRVYRAIDLNMILATNRGSPNRLDIPLDPGATDIDVIKKNDQLAYQPHQQSK
jgi:hypothetical protein